MDVVRSIRTHVDVQSTHGYEYVSILVWIFGYMQYSDWFRVYLIRSTVGCTSNASPSSATMLGTLLWNGAKYPGDSAGYSTPACFETMKSRFRSLPHSSSLLWAPLCLHSLTCPLAFSSWLMILCFLLYWSYKLIFRSHTFFPAQVFFTSVPPRLFLFTERDRAWKHASTI